MPDALTRRLELIARINDQISPQVTQAHAHDIAFNITTAPTPVLKLFPDRNGRALYTMRRRRDGTLHLRHTPAVEPPLFIMDLAKRAYQEQLSIITMELFNRTIRSPLKHELTYAIARAKGSAKHISDAMRSIADTILGQSATSYTVDGVSEPFQHRKQRATINRALQDHLVDHTILGLAGLRYHASENSTSQVTFHQYNDFALNASTYEKMVLEAPQVLTAFRNISHNNQQLLKLPTPDHITQIVREAFQLTPAQWRILTRTPYTSTYEPEQHIAVLRTGIRLLHDVNIPVTTPGFANAIIKMHERHTWALNHPPTWPYGDVWRTWVHIFHQAIANQEQSPQKPHYYQSDQRHVDLTTILDAFIYSVQKDLPWGHTDWASHLRRAQRIHQRMVDEIDFRRTNPESLANWQSLVDSVQIDDYEVTAINDGISVMNLATSMHNCLARYIADCQHGRLRIFTISKKQRLAAAFALNREARRWAVWQVEKPNSRSAHPEHIAVAVKFADHYNIVESKYAAP